MLTYFVLKLTMNNRNVVKVLLIENNYSLHYTLYYVINKNKNNK